MSIGMAGEEQNVRRDGEKAPRYLPSRSQLDAYSVLHKALSDRDGVAFLYGPKRSGRSAVWRQYVSGLNPDVAVVRFDGGQLNLTSLLAGLLEGFGLGCEFSSTAEMWKIISVFAAQQFRSNQAPVVIIENFDRVKKDALQSICELAGLEDRKSFTIRFILVSESAPDWLLASRPMNTIAARLAATAEITAMSLSETVSFLYANLRAETDSEPEEVFPRDTCQALYARSGGRTRAVLELAADLVRNSTSLPVRCEMPGECDNRPRPVQLWEPGIEDGPRLVVTLNGEIVSVIDLDQPKLLIGRSECCDLCVPEAVASKFHALIFRSKDRTGIVDLGSDNGTFVNGQRVADRELRHLDVVSLGNHRFKFFDDPCRDRYGAAEQRFADTVVLSDSDLVDLQAANEALGTA